MLLLEEEDMREAATRLIACANCLAPPGKQCVYDGRAYWVSHIVRYDDASDLGLVPPIPYSSLKAA